MPDLEQFYPLAEQIATKIWNKGGRTLDLDDLKGQAGLILVQASRSYDPSRGKLLQHIQARLNFDLLDYLRKINPLSRDHRQQIKQGTEAPICHQSLTPFEDSAGSNISSPVNMEQEIINRSVVDQLIACPLLDKREKRILIGVHGEMQMSAISKLLDISPGRVSQIFTAVRDKLLTAPVSPRCLECERSLVNDGRQTKQKWFCSRQCANIYLRPAMRKVIDEDELYNLYVMKQLSIAKIAAHLKIGRGAVWSALKRSHIIIRKAAVVARTCCKEEKCGKPCFKVFDKITRRWHGTRCRMHYNLYNASHRKVSLHPETPEQRSDHAKKIWATRRERYGNRGQNVATLTEEQRLAERELRIARTKLGWITRRQSKETLDILA